jgi:hypothetical protein
MNLIIKYITIVGDVRQEEERKIVKIETQQFEDVHASA